MLPGNHNHLTCSIEDKTKQTFSNELPMPSQFQVIRWKHSNESFKTPLSSKNGFEMRDEDYFPDMNEFFQLILSLPVGSYSCERSFSALRRLEIWTRSTMIASRLIGLALMFVHKQRTDIFNKIVLCLVSHNLFLMIK